MNRSLLVALLFVGFMVCILISRYAALSTPKDHYVNIDLDGCNTRVEADVVDDTQNPHGPLTYITVECGDGTGMSYHFPVHSLKVYRREK